MTTARIPARSLDQRLSALQRANEIRSERGRFKRSLHRQGKESALRVVEGVIARPPEWVETMKLRDLLIAIPTWGRVKADKYLCYAKISPLKTVGGLSDRQRKEILELLETGPT